MFTGTQAKVPQGIFQNNFVQSEVAYKLDNVGMKFGKTDALRDVNLKINKGEIIFLTGVSGAGKTTLLNILAGNIKSTTGSYYSCPKSFSCQVFQDLRLIERMSCRENLMYAFDPSLYNSKKEFLGDLNELSKILGINNQLDMRLGDANGGLKQKVAIIRALLARPEVFIADEPTSSLDFDNAKRLFDLLNIYNTKRKMTIIWASHNRDVVQRFTGRIIHLDKGRLIHSGHACFI